MTKDSLKVLEILKRVQITENNTVYLKLDELAARTVVEKGQPFVSVDLSEYSDRLWSILVYLAERHLVENLSGDFEYLRVTHEGWSRSLKIKEMRNQHAKDERDKAFNRKLGILQTLIPFITLVLGALLDHFTGIINWFGSLF